MQYRILVNLRVRDKRILADTISVLKGISQPTIDILLAKNRIAEVQAPPLAILPGFEERATEYEKQGIKDVNDMSGEEEDFDEVLKWSTGFDSPDTIPLDEMIEVSELDTASPLPSGEGVSDEQLED